MSAIAALLLVFSALDAAVSAPAETPPDESARVALLNESFLLHVDRLGPNAALAARTLRDAWNDRYRHGLETAFVPDALAVLSEPYRDALAAFDAEPPAVAAAKFEALLGSPDPYVAASAAYFHARSVWETGDFERLTAALGDLDQRSDSLRRHTPLAPRLWLLKAAGEARCLRYDAAATTLAAMHQHFRGLPELVAIGARQLQLEVERRESGTLDEVASLMTYSAERLRVDDAGGQTRARQQEAIALLDKLIDEMRQQEQQQGSGGRSSGRPGGATPRSDQPAPESTAPESGEAPMGELHAAPRIEPGENWGNLPPAERDRILQAIRERFPSRYRELIEQYYRALAEEE